MGAGLAVALGAARCGVAGTGNGGSAVNATQGEQCRELVGCGEVSRGDGSVLAGVRYRLELSINGTVKGTISAPASERLLVPTGMFDSLVLQLAGGRQIAFEVRVYESRRGGSGRIDGRLLRAAGKFKAPLAA